VCKGLVHLESAWSAAGGGGRVLASQSERERERERETERGGGREEGRAHQVPPAEAVEHLSGEGEKGGGASGSVEERGGGLQGGVSRYGGEEGGSGWEAVLRDLHRLGMECGEVWGGEVTHEVEHFNALTKRGWAGGDGTALEKNAKNENNNSVGAGEEAVTHLSKLCLALLNGTALHDVLSGTGRGGSLCCLEERVPLSTCEHVRKRHMHMPAYVR
jgi:hypothetical protein